MRYALLVLISAIAGTGLAQTKASKDESLSEKLSYQAHWLVDLDTPTGLTYQTLLITRQPLEQLANQKLTQRPHATRSEVADPLPFDHPAVTFRTIGKDSIWSNPFTCVKEFGNYDKEGQTLIVDGVNSKVEPCTLKEVIAILENPLGARRGIHRLAHPLQHAELTARAFTLLLKEQVAQEAPAK